ncbi:MAG: hypothetical protein AMXMBFR84_12440 [Candidatus Hydrogenedentota bacterium]
MMQWVLALIAAAASSYNVYQSSYPRLETLFGPVDCEAITGNGGLTAGFNSVGRLSVFRWPGPGGSNQIAYRTQPGKSPDLGVPACHGAIWGVEIGASIAWINATEWERVPLDSSEDVPIVETRLRHKKSGTLVTQTAFVHPSMDLLVLRIRVEGIDTSPKLHWYCNFSPSTRTVPELPLADWAWDDLNDFAIYLDDDAQTLVHFRPTDPGSGEWNEAQRMVLAQVPADEWRRFSQGTWIAIRPMEPLNRVMCGYGREPFSLWASMGDGVFDTTEAMVGSCAAAIEIEPEHIGDAYYGNVLVAVSNGVDSSHEILNGAMEKRFSGLMNETRTFWNQWNGTVALPEQGPTNLRSFALSQLYTLHACRDKRKGAVIRAPYSQPPLAMDWPRHGVWQTLALDLAGLHVEAESHSMFYSDAVRKNDAKGKPLGTVPTALYGDGTDAMPHLVLDTEAVGWVLWSFWQHAQSISPNERTAYLEKVWESTDLAAMFLSSWADPLDGVPMYTYDEDVLREQRSFGFNVSVFMGMKAATAIAGELEKERLDWKQRTTELENLIRYQTFDAQGNWKHNEGYRLALTGLLEPTDPRWAEAIERAFAIDRRPLTALEVLERLVQFSWLWQGNPERLSTLAYSAPASLRELLDGRPPDALHSALAYLCIRLGYPVD